MTLGTSPPDSRPAPRFVLLPKPEGLDLAPRPALPAAILAAGNPAIRGQVFHDDQKAGFRALAWAATPYRIHPKTRPDLEISLILQGHLRLSLPDSGQDLALGPGDILVLPPGQTYVWDQGAPLLKYALSLAPPPGDGRPEGQGAPETDGAPETEGLGLPADPVLALSRQDLLAGADGQMLFAAQNGRAQIRRHRLAPGQILTLPGQAHHLVLALSGSAGAAVDKGTAADEADHHQNQNQDQNQAEAQALPEGRAVLCLPGRALHLTSHSGAVIVVMTCPLDNPARTP